MSAHASQIPSAKGTQTARNWAPIAVLGAFVLAYCAFLLWNPAAGFGGYERLREVIFASEKFFPSGVFPTMGRFYPMFVKELALIQLISPEIVWLFVFASLQCALFALLMWRLLADAWPNPWVIVACLALLYLLPAFTNSWGALATCERGVVFYLVCFLLAYRTYSSRSGWFWAAAALLAANAAIYYKEPVFGALLVFVAVRTWILWGNRPSGQRVLDSLLVASALSFLVAYIVFAYLPRGEHVYGARMAAVDGIFFRNLANYALNDPIVVFLALPLGVVRLLRIMRNQVQADPIYDPMLVAGIAYSSAFIVLNLYAPNYMLPAYVFVLPPILRFLGRDGAWACSGWRVALVCVVFLMAVNTVPLGLHILSNLKYPPANSIAAMDAVARDLRVRSAQSSRPAIFLEGVAPELTAHEANQTYDRDAYFNVAGALKRRGIPGDAFDLKSELPPKDPSIKPRNDDPAARYSAFTANRPSRPEPGDYFLITPNSITYITPAYIAQLSQAYDLVYRTPSGQWAIPNFSLRTAIKWWLIRHNQDRLMADRNILRWPDYYVFRKK